MEAMVRTGGILLVLFFSVFARASDATVCGTLSEKVFSIDRDYLFFWPEKEGDSWSGNTPQPSGCSDRLKSIVLEAYLPSMDPAGKKDIYNDTNLMHVSVAISALDEREVVPDFSALIKYYLRKSNVQEAESHSKKFGMYYYSGQDPSFSQMHSEVYWVRDLNGLVSVVVKCAYRVKSSDSVCTLTKKVPELDAVMDIKFYYTNLPSWNNISEKSLSLLRSSYR